MTVADISTLGCDNGVTFWLSLRAITVTDRLTCPLLQPAIEAIARWHGDRL